MELLSAEQQRRLPEWRPYAPLIARAYPRASQDTLQLISDWMAWMEALNAQCDATVLGCDPDRLAALYVQVLAAFGGAAANPGALPLVQAAADLGARMAHTGGAGWMARMRRRLNDYCSAKTWEAANRRDSLLPSEAEYCAMRPFLGAVYCHLALIELAEQVELPDALMQHGDVQRLVKLAGMAFCWSSDLAGLAQAQRSGEVHNLVLILQYGRGRSRHWAQSEVLARYNAMLYTFVDLAAHMPSFGTADGALRSYISGMQAWVRANLDWLSEAQQGHLPAAPQAVLSGMR